MLETVETCDGRREKMVCEDRISVLPDDLLTTILLCVPTKEAVTTMILSKRWRFVWTMLPSLEYEDDDDDDESKKSVCWFLNKSMELHKAPAICFLRIKLGQRCPSDADVVKWVSNAVDRRVLMLSLDFLFSADPTRLPASLYFSKYLKALSLSHNILVDISSSCRLPSLTLLHLLSVVYKDEASLVTLLSGCPILKTLCVIRNKDDNVAKFIVKVPSLRFLLYTNRCKSLPDDEVETNRLLVMDTPALRGFHFTDVSGDSWSFEKMPRLKKASIVVMFLPDTDKFLRFFFAVSSLHLTLTREVAKWYSKIKLSRLVKCTLCPHNSEWMDSLVAFLENTPTLKFLVVDYREVVETPISSCTWREFGYPECFFKSLEKFELIDRGGGREEEEKELVEYILENCSSLKTATITFKSTLKVEDQERIMEELKDIHRVSVESELFFKP